MPLISPVLPVPLRYSKTDPMKYTVLVWTYSCVCIAVHGARAQLQNEMIV